MKIDRLIAIFTAIIASLLSTIAHAIPSEIKACYFSDSDYRNDYPHPVLYWLIDDDAPEILNIGSSAQQNKIPKVDEVEIVNGKLDNLTFTASITHSHHANMFGYKKPIEIKHSTWTLSRSQEQWQLDSQQNFTALCCSRTRVMLTCKNIAMADFQKISIPKKIIDHIERDFHPYIDSLLDLGYSKEQEALVIDRYVDSLADEYGFSLSSGLKRVRELITSLLDQARATKSIPDKFKDFGSMNFNQFREFMRGLDKSQLVGRPFAKVNLQYDGFFIPLFIEFFSSYWVNSDNIAVYIDGMRINSERSFPFMIANGGPIAKLTGSKTPAGGSCLSLVFQSQGKSPYIHWLNSSYTACPIPKEKTGTYLLGLAEELARRLGEKELMLEDGSTIRCKKNDWQSRLDVLRIFQRGDSWYGSHGYRDIDEPTDKAAMNNLRFLPLSAVKAGLNGLDLNRIKRDLYYYAEDLFELMNIDRDLKVFGDLKPKFNRAVAKFSKAQKTRNSSLGQFFSWLWEEDCALYDELSRLLFGNQFTKKLPSYKFYERLPKILTKSLRLTSAILLP